MHAHTRGRITPATPARPGGTRRRRRDLGARVLAGLVALALLGAGCSGSSEASSSEPDPTFSRARGRTLEFPEPVATVSQLVTPTEDAPWTVVGSVFDPGSDTSRAATWSSEDGRAWERHDVDPADGDVSESFSAVADTPDGRLAVGWVGDGALSDAAVWRQDGDAWNRIEAPDMGGEHEQWAFDVAASERGILVAGGESVWGEVRARLWFSEDGTSWQTVDGGPGGPFDATGQESLRDIAPFGDGWIAVGSRNLDNEQDGLAWYSPDGREWTQLSAPTLGGSGRQALQTVTVSNGVAVAGGYTTNLAGQGTPVVWRSQDGQRWGRPSGPLPLHDDTRSAAADMTVRSLSVGDGGWSALDTDHLNAGQIMDVTAFSGGFLAVGFEDFSLAKRRTAGENSSPDGLIWVSPDGREWSRVAADIPAINQDLVEILAENAEDQNLPGVIVQTAADQPHETMAPAGGPGTQSLDAVAPLGNGFIAVGVVYNDDQAEPIVVTVGDTSGDGIALRGENPAFTGPGTQRFRDVCVSPDGVAVAVGISGTDGAYDVGVRRRNAEGRWGAARSDDRSFGGPGSQQAYGCAASEDGFVVVGSDDRSGDADARIWTSEDGVTWTRVESGLLGGAGDQWANVVAAVPERQGGGWLIGGTDTVTGDGDVALWRLGTDGDLSRRDRGEPELGGPGEQSVNDIAIDDERVLIVGDDFGRAGVWESGTVDR